MTIDIISLLQILSILAIIYFLYDRVVLQYYNTWYYKKQGIPFMPGNIPLLGHMPTLIQSMIRTKRSESPIIESIDHFYNKNPPSTYGIVL